MWSISYTIHYCGQTHINGLEGITFSRAGLTALVINSNTTGAARARGENLWVIARKGFSMILLSPEMLVGDGFESLLVSKDFTDRMYALRVDEVHLCCTCAWGGGFRPAFTEIGFIRARMPKKPVLILTTATLADGEPTLEIMRFFGLRPGYFHLIRRSNLRPDIRILFRTRTKGIQNPSHPDFKWVLHERRKKIIFCAAIRHGHSIVLYLRDLLSKIPGGPDPTRCIRPYNSADYADYNEETLRLFREDPLSFVIVATDTLMVGIDLPNVQDVIIASTPATVDEMLQKFGRAGRDRKVVTDARGIIYISRKVALSARKLVEGSNLGPKKHSQRGNTAQKKPLDRSVARMIVAPCKTAMINTLYANPSSDPPCLCPTCAGSPQQSHPSCNCSGCMPEDSTMPTAQEAEAAPKGGAE